LRLKGETNNLMGVPNNPGRLGKVMVNEGSGFYNSFWDLFDAGDRQRSVTAVIRP